MSAQPPWPSLRTIEFKKMFALEKNIEKIGINDKKILWDTKGSKEQD